MRSSRSRLAGFVSAFAFAVASILPVAALAAPITIDLEWDGDAFGNGAHATGSITFSSLSNSPGFGFDPLAAAGVTALSVTVTGAVSGNGTYGIGDFSDIVFYAFAALDFSAELCGQAGFSCVGGTGDFNLFNVSPGAPGGTANFVLTSDDGLGSSMQLVSMVAQQVPEPYVPVLLGLGLAGLLLVRRRPALHIA
jgi:hypothetical protein